MDSSSSFDGYLRITTATCHLMPDNNSKNTMEDTNKHLLKSNNNLLERKMEKE